MKKSSADYEPDELLQQINKTLSDTSNLDRRCSAGVLVLVYLSVVFQGVDFFPVVFLRRQRDSSYNQEPGYPCKKQQQQLTRSPSSKRVVTPKIVAWCYGNPSSVPAPLSHLEVACSICCVGHSFTLELFLLNGLDILSQLNVARQGEQSTEAIHSSDDNGFSSGKTFSP